MGSATSTVHPRVCGGNPERADIALAAQGTSPRVRGNLGLPIRESLGVGTSPRVRGKRLVILNKPVVVRYIPACAGKRIVGPYEGRYLGYIPACAGETQGSGDLWGLTTVHPRVCGGNAMSKMVGASPTGTSPRVRGKLTQNLTRLSSERYIPACAGETDEA